MRYGPALRRRILELYDRGLQTKQIAEQLMVCPAGARRVKQRRNDPPKKVGGGHFKLDTQACQTLVGWVEQKPDATLEELRKRVAAELNIAVSIGTIWNTLRRLKLSRKKSRSRPASRSGRMSRPSVSRSSSSSKTSH
jgi:transposase